MELEEMTAFFTSRLDLYDEHMLREVPGCRVGYARMAALLPDCREREAVLRRFSPRLALE